MRPFLAWVLATWSLSANAAVYTALTPLPDSYRLHGAVASGGFLYHYGGLSGTVGIAGAKKVFFAKTQTDGTIGAWTASGDLPEASFSHASAAWNKTLYLIGGQRFVPGVGLGPSNTVYFARQNADGTLGAWTQTTPLPHAAFFLNAAFWEGRLYVTGGWNSAGLLPDVYSAAAQPDGTLGAWRRENPLPEGVYTHAAAADRTLYVLGGVVNGGADVSADVYYAVIGADGTLGPWAPTTSLPTPLSNLGSVVSGSRVYVTGGWSGTENSKATYSAPILADHSLGTWTTEADLPFGRTQHATTTDGASLFVTGGFSDTPLSDAAALALPKAEPPAPAVLPALVRFSPTVLNRYSHGQWVSAELAFRRETASASDIDPESLAITAVDGAAIAPIPVARKNKGGAFVELESSEELGVRVLEVKFDRAAVQAVVHDGETRLTVSGALRDGRRLAGDGRIWGKAHDGFARRRGRNRQEAIKLCANAALKGIERSGGEVRAERAGVRLPEGALSEGLAVSVVEDPPVSGTEKTRRAAATDKIGLKTVGAPVEYGPHGTRFSKPVTIELPYAREQIPSGVKESELTVHYWNDARGAWEALPSIVDTAARVVRAQTTHFSQYQILSGGSVAAAGLDFDEVYAYPNPARGGANPVIRVQVPLADRVELRIYDVSGTLLHSAHVMGAAAAHEFVWDASRVASGVYYYVVTATASNSSAIVRRGKLAVIR